MAEKIKTVSKHRGYFMSVRRWVDSWSGLDDVKDIEAAKVDWVRSIPLVLVHAMCFGVIWVGWSWTAVTIAVALYGVRMFGITGGYHRYFAHRTYKTSRWFQCALAILGASAATRGPLWWAGHHRHHHRFSDQPQDLHSPVQDGFLWSHMGWVTSRTNFLPDLKSIGDFAKFPELRFIDRYDVLIPFSLAVSMFILGTVLEAVAPGLGTTGPQLLIWGFFISTTVLIHGTCTINSLAHQFGSKRYQTDDQSRNNWFLAIGSLGEGWHNNHHYYPAAARQGFYWWEIDLSYYALIAMSWLGLVWDVRNVPEHVRESGRIDVEEAAA